MYIPRINWLNKVTRHRVECFCSRSGTKMVRHAYRKHEGVVTVYELAIVNAIQTTPRKCLRTILSLLRSALSLLYVVSSPSLLNVAVRIVKVRLTAVVRGRSTILERRKNTPTTGKRFEILSAPIVRIDAASDFLSLKNHQRNWSNLISLLHVVYAFSSFLLFLLLFLIIYFFYFILVVARIFQVKFDERTRWCFISNLLFNQYLVKISFVGIKLEKCRKFKQAWYILLPN